MTKHLFLLIAASCMILINVGCKAAPAKNAGFVDPKFMKNDPTLPFNTVWKKPGFDMSKYTRIYILPTNTSYLLAESDWQKGDRKDQFMADVGTIARYTESTLKKAYTDDPKHRMTVVDADPHSPDCLTLEVAITEIVPSKVVLNALGYAPFFIGMGVTAARFVAQDESTCAMEARFRDSATGETQIMIADREAEQMAIVSIRGLTWYSHIQTIVSQWSGQFVEMASQKPGQAIKPTDTFTLQPW